MLLKHSEGHAKTQWNHFFSMEHLSAPQCLELGSLHPNALKRHKAESLHEIQYMLYLDTVLKH